MHANTLKAGLRARALAARDSIGPSQRAAAARALAAKASAFNVSGTIVAAYHAIGSELDPAALCEGLERQGAQMALPVLLDLQTMVFRRWQRGAQLVPAGFGTAGPEAAQPEVVPHLILAPLAAFSAGGQRIGYGKGHYDRALCALHAAGRLPAYLGLAFDQQEVDAFSAEPHDVPLDGVLTPSGLRIFEHGQGALKPFLTGEVPAKARP